ncbi:MAG TPA: hypothetical protein VGO00_16100 [Kofleriaceae bacterium]|jgi:hypothetical protein|nr:hypothetical protein [Kofleriaceae bacterium]
MRSLVVVAVLSAGCNLYWGHHGGDDICPVYNQDEAEPAIQLRNPETGICESVGGGGGGCGSSCGGPCAEPGGVQEPNWPTCQGSCEGLGEAACLTSATCHAAYVLPIGSNMAPTFWQCWDTTTFGGVPPKTTAACTTLVAEQCIFRDDCIGIYPSINGQFESCAAEPANMSCDATTCAMDTHCEQQCTGTTCRAYCVPDDLCTGVDCGTGSTCVETCDATTGTCMAVCEANTACAALATETACKSRTDCEPVYKGDDCTCLPDGCTCTIETYERCQAL